MLLQKLVTDWRRKICARSYVVFVLKATDPAHLTPLPGESPAALEPTDLCDVTKSHEAFLMHLPFVSPFERS